MVPPGANGTTMRTGLVGQPVWASAVAGHSEGGTSRAPALASSWRRRIECMAEPLVIGMVREVSRGALPSDHRACPVGIE